MGTSANYHQARQENRLAHLRRRIAVDAARLMTEGGIRDYQLAKRKAAQRLGIHKESQLPRNIEIQAALREHQRLFSGAEQLHQLHHLRLAAREALAFFGRFHPRLVGAVLEGTADQHSAVCLHLFADTPEEVALFLNEQGIPFDESERRLRFGNSVTTFQPVFQFHADQIAVDLTVFPTAARKQPPLSQVDGKPMQRANLTALESLIG